MIDYGIAGKVAIVTGGSRGVGRGVALALASQGVKVAITARRANLLEETAAEIRKATPGADVMVVPADMGSYDAIKRMVMEVGDHYGRIDILINNAASFAYGSTFQLTDEDWLNHFNIKTFGYFRCMREVAPYMQKNHWGRIINIAGSAARQGGLGGGGSAGATNAAIINMGKSVGDTLARDGVTVNSVHPGASDSDREELQIAYAVRETGRPAEEIARQRAANIPPMGRKVVSADTAQLVMFLCSEQAAAISGQTVAVDGGSGRGVFY